MREGWKVDKIGNYVDLQQGFALNKKSDYHISDVPTQYPLLKISDLINNTETLFVKESIPKQFLIHEHELIFSRTGQVGLIFKGKKGVIYNNCFKIIPNELIDSDYIYYYFKQDYVIENVRNLATGAAQPDLNHSAFKSIDISFPESKETQRKIAKILSNYDDLIENNLKRIKILEEMAQQTYEEWFVRMRFPGHESATINPETGLPEGWEKVKLGEVCNFSQGLQVPIEKQFTQFSNELIRFIRIVDVTQNTNDIRYIESPKSLNQFVHFKDVFMVRYGAPQVVTNYHGIIANNFFRININDENKLKRKFLFSFLNRNEIKENLLAMSVSATMPAISFKSFSTLDIILPEIEVQAKFHKYVDTTYDLILNLQNQNQRLREARDILLPRLMMGMVEV